MNDPDERISAYLDGALSDEEARAFETDLEKDPDLAERFARWQGNDAMLRAGFEPEPVDDALLNRLGLGPAEEPKTAEVIDLAARRRKPPPAAAAAPGTDRRAWAAAAAILIVAGVAGSLLLSGAPGQRTLADSKAFQTALSQLPSQRTATLEDGSAVTPVLSFAAGDGRFCREFRHDAAGAAQEGIACRGGDRWLVEGIAVAAAQPDGGIAPAGGGDTAALDAVYAKLNPSDPFGADEEARHIEQGWSGSTKNAPAAE